MKTLVASLLLTLLVAYVAAERAHEMSCTDVDMCIAPCISYLTGEQQSPAPACCNGLKKLRTLAAGTTAERRFACNCIKQAAAHLKNLKDDAVSKLPAACGTPLPFPISLEYDCSR
ncbi:Non-specific lipid-transfer protein [Ananas comosus]|uniref:Non-specific lipid-transfer protein n=1 Tax=Ananas comosus TaxID=4615 RepID=A0A199VEL8_ANACO|nr:Non-specific lipid-transfer protein [Ananas comosus]